jgi:hypothetical protein
LQPPSRDEDFFRFVAERHKIWHRRFFLKQSPPWTEDLVLAQYHFTNVYRELDRGTVWYLENIASCFKGNLGDAIWQTLAYRLVNSVDTWSAIGKFPELRDWEWSRKDIEDKLRGLQKIGSIYSKAYITLQLPRVSDRITNFIEFMDEAWEQVPSVGEIPPCMDLKGFAEELTQLNGVAMFTAYEVVCDLLLVDGLLPWSIDDWANLGPGARLGLYFLTGSRNYKIQYEKLLELRHAQPECFDGMEMPFWQNKVLNLRNIEHSCCEWMKYKKLQNGKGRKRYFLPKESGWLEQHYDKVMAS